MSAKKLNVALFTVALTGSLTIETRFVTLAETKASRGGMAADTGDSNQEKIARAMSAGPIDIASSARIVNTDAQGHEVVLREGANGFTCMPGNPKVIGEPPMCADAASMQWSADFKAHKPKPTNTVPGIIYMLAGATQRSDSDRYDKTSSAMREQGQLQPILLRHRRDGYELISGRHRLEAAKKLNTRVQAVVNFNLNNDDMLLAEIDENLIRGELDALERSEHMVKRKELYERKHPETKAGKSQAIGMNKALGHNVVAKLAPTFTKATAAKTGISEGSIERDVARGSQTRLGDIKGTSLAKGIELDALAKLEKIDPAKRDTIIDLAKAGKKVSATAEIADASEAKLDNNISARAIAERSVAEEIALIGLRECRANQLKPHSDINRWITNKEYRRLDLMTRALIGLVRG